MYFPCELWLYERDFLSLFNHLPERGIYSSISVDWNVTDVLGIRQANGLPLLKALAMYVALSAEGGIYPGHSCV